MTPGGMLKWAYIYMQYIETDQIKCTVVLQYLNKNIVCGYHIYKAVYSDIFFLGRIWQFHSADMQKVKEISIKFKQFSILVCKFLI